MFKTFSRLVLFRSYCVKSSLKPTQTTAQAGKISEEFAILSGIPHENWENAYTVFSNYGFKNEDILQLLKSNRTFLKQSSNVLAHHIEFWRNFQFGEKQFQELIMEHPELLDIMDHKEVANRISYLKHQVNTPKNIWRLLINSPTIITYRDTDIKNRFAYMQNQMRLQIYEIVKSKVFSKSLKELKFRHILLERLGIFKPRPLKSDPNEPTKNPRLYQIIDTTDKEFCTKICGISLIEFETFIELLNKEEVKVENEEESDG